MAKIENFKRMTLIDALLEEAAEGKNRGLRK